MRSLLLLFAGAACLSCAVATADQFKARCECKNPEEKSFPVGDRPDHTLGVESTHCTWSRPLEIAGDKTKESVATNTTETMGTKTRIRGVHELTMESGDKLALPYQGTVVVKENNGFKESGTFSITEGTGKLKGIKGKGTFDCKPASDGVSCDVEGEYALGK